MLLKSIKLLFILNCALSICAGELLGCGGFIKSHVPIDFSKVAIKLLTKQGILKDKTNCAPNNGYYFLPLYEKGEYVLELEPPRGWSFNPPKIELIVDGTTDLCSKGRDVNFEFKGFGIAGKVDSLGANIENNGPVGIEVELTSKTEKRSTLTDATGHFSFTPVYPGTYTISIRHHKWKIIKNSINVQVTEGNTDLPAQSLIIQGYDVVGSILNNGEPLPDTHIVLFEKDGKAVQYAEGCITETIKGLKTQHKPVCYVKTNKNGQFTFPTVPNGHYYIMPYVIDNNIFFEPKSIKFTVSNNNVELKEHFVVTGFTIVGHVFKSVKGEPIDNARIILNGKEVTRTDKNGQYKLDKIQSGNYKLKAESDGVIFHEINVVINPKLSKLPDLVPSLFKVCGRVLSDESQTVTFNKVGSSVIQATTDGSGKFCEFLAPGQYELEVNINNSDKQKGLQFFPVKQTIHVSTDLINDIVFSQLKATITGSITCIRAKDCEGVTLKLISVADPAEQINLKIIGDKYTASQIFPGHYELQLNSEHLCWKTNKQTIFINSAKVDIPPFVQTGYLINFVSTHQTKLSYKNPKDNKPMSVNINAGKNQFCVENPGQYNFVVESCHSFEKSSYSFNTDTDTENIILNALKHKVTLDIESASDFGKIQATIKIDDKTHTETLSYSSGKYNIELLLGATDEAIIVPKSDILYFDPPVLTIPGVNDCTNLGNKFSAVKGKVFKGKVIPALAGVTISVENDNTETLTVETANDGTYKFPALDGSLEYKISAKKESYVIIGPDSDGNFKAHKLAEIFVDVLDEAGVPLQGALLSLSGGESYRSNLQTNENGKITFHSLSPSDYFLRPMMKEYKFEPESKIIKVKEGESVKVVLIGKRVAYSAFGQVTSLNGEPEENMIVKASGTGNCSHYSEETISESNGNFRIRGLQPNCAYEIGVQQNSDGKQRVDRSLPSVIHVHNVNQDIKDLKIVVFKPTAFTDVLIKIHAKNVEHYKFLRLKITRDTSAIIFNGKIDSNSVKMTKDNNPGVLVHLPQLTLDGKTYIAQLESTLPSDVKWTQNSVTFNANSSFKYLELSFSVLKGGSDQHIKQTSLWTLLSIFVVIFIIYNMELVAPVVKEKLAAHFGSLQSMVPTVSKKTVETYDNTDLDQIVQDINNVRKKGKPKKN